MPERHRIAAVSEVAPGTGKEIVAGGKIVALFNVDGTFHALDGICPHAGGPLAKGRMTGCIVTCPWHGWQFDVTTGRHRLNATLTQPSFPVTIEGDDVFVEIP